MMNKDQIKNYWETSNEKMSHLSEEYVQRKGYNAWKTESFINWSSFKDKIILDYGIGGGYLGRMLFNEYDIKKYIGVDIAERQLNAAKELLKNTNSEFHCTPVNFKDINCDIFISLAVIQHFPTLDYLVEFLENLNLSTATQLILQIRHSNKTIFNGNYEKNEDVRLACHTNKEFLNMYLTNYSLEFSSPIKKNNYQYLFYNKK